MTFHTPNQPVVFITGASGGFGLLTSLACAEAGYLVVASMRDLSKSENLMEQARKKGVEASIACIRLDVTNQEDIDSAVPEVINRFDAIDVLINNAGYAAGGFTEEVPLEAWREQFETNLFGLIAVTKAVLPHMRKRQDGTIINLSSISGRMALPGLGPYAASKFAVEGFSEALRLEMLPHGVHVVLVEPGSYQTDIWSKGMSDFNVDLESPYSEETETLMKMVSHIAKTADDPEEVTRLIVKVTQENNPNLRYPVGKNVKTMTRLKTLLPWRWLEHMILKKINPRK
ncbi:SDR family oxidoreductase [Lentibacillus amyloliquefaciens]|uniref:Short-chain dehydrogenase n=1 Tax=Lentibacillus amyloliquefaciens TaxID=1472767 RepID=A0A0U4DU04_9BACI|nr:SDR family oxidoreductase [Lentibacillus amyloliquefaciens]ALX48840.1 short-chain dehydrogenase [Lentibacillus amyloliquefaciens]